MNAQGEARGCRRGCQGGCLGCLVLLLLLSGGTIAGWIVWGQPWLARRAARVDRAVPGLRTVIDLARGRAPFAVRSLPESPGDRDVATAMPGDVWLPDSRYDAAYHVGDGTAVAVFDLPVGDAAASPTTWRREMSARGWHRTPVPDPPAGSALLFEREGARCSVELVPIDDDAVQVWLRFKQQ